ncbi:hypothetical protein ACOSYY_04660 [Nitrospira sp. BLG_2]
MRGKGSPVRARVKLAGRHAADGGRVNLDESPAARTLDDQALTVPTRYQLPAVAPDVHARGSRLVHDSPSFAHGLSSRLNSERSNPIHEEQGS